MPSTLSALSISCDSARLSLAYPGGPSSSLTLPTFEVEGQRVDRYALEGSSEMTVLSNGAHENTWTLRAEAFPALRLDLTLRGFPHSPVVRMQYRLRSATPLRLTKSGGSDAISYFTLQSPALGAMALTDIQLSHFDPVAHSYMPYRQDYPADEVMAGMRFVGPIAVFHSAEASILAAYEHGADHPLSFFQFTVEGDGAHRELSLTPKLTNYAHNRLVETGRGWASVWFELALFPGPIDAFLPVYRRFFLEEVCINPQSRQPYLFYNSWNYQERQKYFHNRPYLAEMNAERMLAEIDTAHAMGVDVFVIDTGWYIKTGDWLPNLERFPEGLKEIKRRLDGYGMKLGLWFNPTVAALTSRIYQEHPEYEVTLGGKPRWRGQIWETEESAGMCLASDYAADFVETMVRLNRELGVSYFKWDAVAQFGCDSPLHNHGTAENAPEERAELYGYESGRAMIRIVEEVSRRCPDVIVDFDVTEGGRFVGLGFLSVGKYFLVNNGPYFHDFDIPRSVKMEPDTINVFFYPGPARPRICRQGVKYDPFIPSILFLTHYLPDPPRLSQENSWAALVLGGSGWWGDLPALSSEDVASLGEQAALYQQVAAAATHAYPRVRGFAGSSPEIHEKIEPHSAAGLVVFFTVAGGEFTHYTQPVNPNSLGPNLLGRVVGADEWQLVEGNRLKITVRLGANGARVVYLLPDRKDEREA